jgi:hypothetical protein
LMSALQRLLLLVELDEFESCSGYSWLAGTANLTILCASLFLPCRCVWNYQAWFEHALMPKAEL